MKNDSVKGSILITGGTSGLGYEIVSLFLKKGFFVIAMGRKIIDFPEFPNRFLLYQVDFGDLNQLAEITKFITENHNVDYIVNNAGVLSGPEYTKTINGFEYSMQVNFLSHLIINEIIISGKPDERRLRIAVITSPMYRMAQRKLSMEDSEQDYSIVKTYSSSKLYLILMCQFFRFRYPDSKLKCFSFNPGIFRSGIYRMQKKWFWNLYSVGALFMRNPEKVANRLFKILTETELENGLVYYTWRRHCPPPFLDEKEIEAFMKSCYNIIDPFLKNHNDIK